MKDNDNDTQATLAGWARDAFSPRLCSQPVYHYANNQERSRIVASRPRTAANAKHSRKIVAPHIGKVIYELLCETHNNYVLLSGEVVTITLQKLLGQDNEQLLEYEKLFVKFLKE